MKKISVLFLLATMFAINTKASEPETTDVKNQYVKWNNIPNATDVKVDWLKNAMQAKSIAGADVRSNANSYIGVWGENLYNQVLAGDASSFKIAKSRGGEINWALNSSGQPVQSGILAENVDIVTFNGIAIAKWGTNGCLNALSAKQSFANDDEDQDNRKQGSNNQRDYASGGPNNNNNNIYVDKDPSASMALAYFKDGMATQQASTDHAAIMFMAIASNAKQGNCNTCPSGNTATATISAQPSMYYIASAPQQQTQSYQQTSGQLNVNVRNKANGWDIANTVLNGANTFFNGVNTYRGVRLEGNRNQNVRYNNTWTGSTNPTVSYGNGFQGSNQLGASFNGNNGQFGSSSNQFGNTTGGSWGNTWN